jgi:putative transposase
VAYVLCSWKAKFGGMDVSEAQRLRQLEDENAKLKKLLAEQMLDAATLRELLSKNGKARHRARACRVSADRTRPVRTAREMVRYGSCRPPDTELRFRLRELANARRRFGYRRLFVLLRQHGEPSGLNRIYRLYREEGLSVRKRRARRRVDDYRAHSTQTRP